MNIGPDMVAILEAARWAPSADNTQPWRFKVVDDNTVHIICPHDEENILSNFSGHEPDFLALGCVIENMRIAAAGQNKIMDWKYIGGIGKPNCIEVHFQKTQQNLDASLIPYIETRSVNRRPYKTTRLTAQDKNTLEQALGGEFKIRWFEDWPQKLRLSCFLAAALALRMQMKSTREFLVKTIDTRQRFSPTKVPIDGIKLDPLSMAMNKFMLAKPGRIKIIAFIPGALISPQIQVEILPGVQCAAHFSMEWQGERPRPPQSILEAGQCLQKFWLEATRRGLVMQPTYAFTLFHHNGKFNPEYFTKNLKQKRHLKRFAEKFEAFYGPAADRIFFTGRIGHPKSKRANARSIRRPLEDLLI